MKGSLRKQRDRQLEEPYRSWINGEVSLPADVTILPRKIDVQSDAMLLCAVVFGLLHDSLYYFSCSSGLLSPHVSIFGRRYFGFVLIGSVVCFLACIDDSAMYWSLGPS